MVLHLLHQLDADDAGRAREAHLVEDLPAHQPEVAVHVAQPQAEGELDEPVVEPADHDPVQRVVAGDLVAVHEVHLGREGLEQRLQLARVVLRVAVGVEDELLRGGGEAGAQRPAVAAVLLVVDHLEPREVPRHLVEQLAGVVRAAVVDHDHLVVVGERPRRHVRHQRQARDGAGVVVGGKEDAETGFLCAHGCSEGNGRS